MRSLGADPSSSSAGLALSDGAGKLIAKDVWKPPQKATRPQALSDYYTRLLATIAIWEPDVAVVLQIMNVRGSKTVRALSYFEAVTMLALERSKVAIYTINDGHARHAVLGIKITASKDEMVEAVRTQFPAEKWSTIRHDKQGKLEGPGLDEMDGFVASLAWKTASEK